MILYSLRAKILALVGGGLLIATVIIAYLAHNGIQSIIDRSQTAVYQSELTHLLLTLAQYDDELEKTLQVEVYRDQFQEEALRVARLNFLTEANEDVFPFILDNRGQVLLHPYLKPGDKSLLDLDFIQSMLQTTAGNFKYRGQGKDKWLVYARFEPWDWVVAYTLNQSYMYADLTHFQKSLLPILVAFLILVDVVLLYGLQRFLRPIINLTQSADAIAKGDLDQPIVARGRDEVAVLARNFESMRTAVRQTINSLDLQRKVLEKEVADRVSAESQAQAAEERLRVIINSVADALLVTDLNHRVVMSNTAAREFFPRVRAENRLREILNDPALEEAIEAIVCGNKKQVQVEWCLQQEGADPHVFIANSAAVFEPDNKLVGVVTLLHDVTKAKELDRLKSEFLSTAAHELRTPLTIIHGFVELLESRPETPLQERQEYLGVVLQRCGDLETLIEDLLDVSRIETGQSMLLNIEEFDLSTVLEKEVNFFQNVERKRQFVIHPSTSSLNVSADSSKIRRVLGNLLSNATKFSKPGSRIEISSERRDGLAWILVKDFGIGIPQEKLGLIFDKFYRVDGSDTAPRGLGLGLYIVNSIVIAHNGQLKLESQPGQGTTVSFGLPLIT